MNRVEFLWWHLKQPQYWADLISHLERKAHPLTREKGAAASELLCMQYLLDPDELAAYIPNFEYFSLEETYGDILASAELRCAEVPVKMGGPGATDLLYSLAQSMSAKVILETGVAFGWSSLSLLLSLAQRDGQLYSVDMPYPARNNERYVGLAVPEDIRSKWHLYRGSDRRKIPVAIADAGQLDMCHYDSDKTYQGRWRSYPILWNALRSGGIFVSDDIGDNTAFFDFSHSLGQEPLVVRWKKQFVGILIKP